MREDPPIGGRHKESTKKSKEDPNRLQAIGLDLGDYTQWVRLRVPTQKKKKKEKTYRMVAVDLFKILDHGDGEVPYPVLGEVHRSVRSYREEVRGIRVWAAPTGAGVLQSKLFDRLHLRRRA